MKNNRTRKLSQRVRYALIAGMAGAFLIPQVAFAAPTVEKVVSGGATVSCVGNDTNIKSDNTNNVIEWRDYSVNQGEIVQYDGGVTTGAAAHNYLNIVTGANTSNINGKIIGGNHVYIVNPNGVIFGKNAEVNVGNLYVSTQELSAADAAVTAFSNSGASPLSSTAELKSDVVNMGKITADTVEVHGKNIRFLNAANVHTTASPVVLHTDTANGGYAHIGYKSGSMPTTTDYQVNGAAATAADNYYQLVSTKEELAAINTTNLAGNYMLEKDIDLSGVAHAPIGNATKKFTGKFDGNFFQIKKLNVSDANDAGLFGVLSGARIDNLGIVGGSVTSNTGGTEYAGGLAGKSLGAKLYNVYVKGTKITGNAFQFAGILGYAENTTIDGAYSTAVVGANDSAGGAGIIGTVAVGANTTKISNVYSDAIYTDKDDKGNNEKACFLGGSDPAAVEIKYSYVTGRKIAPDATNIQANFTDVYAASATKGKMERVSNPTADELDPYSYKTYKGFSINNDGAPGKKWRIYEGRTLPLLTAFMNGRVDSAGSVGANYSYRKFNQADGFAVNDPANTATSNNHADITKNPHDPTKDLIYDSKVMKIVDSAGNAGDLSNVTYDKTLTDDQKNAVQMYMDTGTPLSKTDNARNAGTKAMLWSDQDGPNLRNVNVTIGQRKVDVKGGAFSVEREYNGSADVTNDFKAKFEGGGLSANGFIDGDGVTLTYTNFKATMQAEGAIRAKDANDNDGDPLKKVKFEGKIEINGSEDDKNNYDTSGLNFGSGVVVNGQARITKAQLTLNVRKDSATKIYDGADTVTQDDMDAATNLKLKNEDIKTDADTGKKDEVSLDTDAISGPTYVKADGTPEIHAGDNHKIRYQNVALKGADRRNYKLVPSSTTATLTGTNLDLKGTITRRRITTNDFKVYEQGTNNPVEVTKTYDGNDIYDPTTLNPPKSVYLSTDKDGDTGIVGRDKTHITFAMKEGTTGKFNTKHVKGVSTISYTVRGKADADMDTDGSRLYRLSDYYVDVGGAQKNLEEEFAASGKGTITPKQLTAKVTSIEKTYDGKQEHTDSNGNTITGVTSVTLEGFVTVDGKQESRTNTSTAVYDSPNVQWDAAAQTEKDQNVTYTVSFDKGDGDASDDYVLDPAYQTLTGRGTIRRRTLNLTMDEVKKTYDGTAGNRESGIKEVKGADGDAYAATVAAADGITADTLKEKHTQLLQAPTPTVTSTYGRIDNGVFRADKNASNGTKHTVRYENLDEVVRALLNDATKENNYKVADTADGAGTIERRRIDSTGFQVRDKYDNIADATKVYDGKNTFTLKEGEHLVAQTATTPTTTKTGIVAGDAVFFRMTGDKGHFLKGDTGTDRTSHVSEAKRVAYDVFAAGDENVLKNYTFGTAAEEAAGTLKDLEKVTKTDPYAVTAKGSITPAKIVAQGKTGLNKTYDGVAGYTKGDRKENATGVVGDNVVMFQHFDQKGNPVDGLIADKTGTPTNTSTAVYLNDDGTAADKNVRYAADGKTPAAKAMEYTAQLTGKYADDYEIVDADNNVISEVGVSGDDKTVTLKNDKRLKVDGAGTIFPRKLNITMESVSKVYDTGSTNTATNNTAVNPSGTVKSITDEPSRAVIGDILRDDRITKEDLGAAWRALRDHGDATSSYGHRKSNDGFDHDPNASTTVEGHDVRYRDMDTAFKNQFGVTAAGNYLVASDAYGKGTITPKALDPKKFNVEDANGVAVPASKTYDGTSDFTVREGWKIRPSTGTGTGLYSQDADKVKFKLSQNGAYFIDKNGNKTAHASNKGTAAETDMDAVKASYHVIASADSGYKHLLKNYTLNGKTLDSGEASVTGEGRIERRVLRLDLVQDSGIDKVYDGKTTLDGAKWNELQTTANPAGNVKYAAGSTDKDKLVTTDGTIFNITSNYMNDAGTLADKNVKRNGGNIVDKDILYNISITRGDARNYSFNKGGTVKNAETGLELWAKGTITPKDLSGAFEKVTKVYDGTVDVDPVANPTVTPAQVGFTAGAVIAGDDVTLATHKEKFQSKHVNGDGVNTWKPTEGPEKGNVQKNWINYSNLTLSGTDAGNYRIDSEAKGLGEITPYKINPKTNFNVTFDGRPIAKTYDGTPEADRSHIRSVTFTGVPKDSFTYEVKDARYDNGGHRDGKDQHNVTYTLAIRPGDGVDLANYDLSKLGTLGSDRTITRTNETDGRIYARPVYVKVNGIPTKTYDGSEELMKRAVDGDGNVIRTADQLVTLSTGTKDSGSGLLGTDGTRNATKAVYTDKNVLRNAGAPADRPNGVKYTLALTGGDVTDYEFTTAPGYATVNTVGTAKETMGAGRINPRKLTLDIAHVSKEYDQTSTNNATTNKGPIRATVQAADNTDGRAQDALNAGGLASFDFSNTVTSDFVATEDSRAENVRRSKDGTVIEKPVVYRNIRAELSARLTAVGNTIDNYEVEDTAHGEGKITPYRLTSGNVKIRVIKDAEKEYDGDNIVRYQGSDKPEDVRNNLSATVKINGVDVSILDGVVAKATYDNNPRGNVKNEQQQKVTYQLSYRAGNIELPEGTVLAPENPAYGIITRRDLRKYVPPHLAKVYDGKDNVVYDTSKSEHEVAPKDRPYIDAIRKHSLTSVIEKDKGVVNLTVTGTFDKNATTDTLQEAQTGTSGRHTVNYTLNLTGSDAEILDNYKIGGHPVQGTATGTIDISRRTLTLDVDQVPKPYDGTSRVVGLTKDKLHLSGFVTEDVPKANQKFDNNAVDQIKGVYTDSRGNSSADVEWYKGQYKGQYAKAVKYTNLNNALKDMARRDPNSWARNYRLDDKAYTIDQAKGAITPRDIRADQVEISRFAPVAKEYDGTRLVKDRQPLMPHAYIKDEHGNYLVNDDGSRLDIRGNLKVDWDEHRTHYENPNVTVGGSSQDVTYGMNYVGSENLNISGKLTGTGKGDITRRRLVVKTDRFMPTKVYDTNRTILGVAYDQEQGGKRIITQDDLNRHVQFKHYGDNADGIVDAHTTHHVDAKFDDPTVAWSVEKPGSDPHVMWQDRRDVDSQNVTYTCTLSGAGASNYELVDNDGNAIKDKPGNLKYDGSVPGKGKILPYTITMKADRVELRSNDPMPSTFTGVVKDGERVLEKDPNGKYTTQLGDSLDGTFVFDAESGGARWGTQRISGRYVPGMNLLYRNYLFVQDPANATALHLGAYLPDYEYYKALTQTSKMLPDEYAYENASLDYRSHFGRDATAEIAYTPPSINMVKDGTDLSKTEIRITDESVFSLVNEVFGA